MSHAPQPPDQASTRRHRRGSGSRRGWWLAALLTLLWLAVGAFVGPFSGKLTEVQKNDNASFLPASAESTQVLELQKKFQSQDSVPMIQLWSDDAGVTPQALAAVTDYLKRAPSLPLEGEDKTVGDYLLPTPLVPVPSEDGKAVLAVFPLNGDTIAQPLPSGESPVYAVAQALRKGGADLAPGLTTHVTGPGGILADFIDVFGAIDTTLLLVTALVVAVILILVYRSPFLWVLPLLSAGLALSLASAVVYLLAKNDVVKLNGQSQGILTVLVFGAGTDYALLLISRYREELHHHQSRFEAMRAAWRGVLEPIVASAATVTVGLLCLLFSELNSNKSTGPVSAVGILSALLVTLTFLPAVLVLFPRGIFWPKVPQYDDVDEKLSGLWARVSRGVGRRPRAIWVATTLGLLVAAAFATTLKADGISQTDAFTKPTDSVKGQEQLAEHFPAGSGSPAIIIGKADELQRMVEVTKATPGVATVVPFTGVPPAPGPGGDLVPVTPAPKVVDGLVELQATLTDPPDSPAAEQTVLKLREQLTEQVPQADAKVGGFTAINLDTQQASQRDRRVIIPIVLLVILLILGLLLRAVVAPILLIATVVLSYLATLGVSAVMFNHVFKFAGADSSFPLFAFVFLVALGIDYNIFLMTRVREESAKLGTRPGILKGLTVTGGVITSAGVVLAATFAVLGVLPLVFLAQLGFTVAFGVLLDTVVVRSLLVPAASYDLGSPLWWPSALARRADVEAEQQRAAMVPYVREGGSAGHPMPPPADPPYPVSGGEREEVPVG